MEPYNFKIGHFLMLVVLPLAGAVYAYILIIDIWEQIDANKEVIAYLEGHGYAFICLFFPVFYLTVFPRFKKYQLYAAYLVTLNGLICLLIIPRVIDYITEQKLIDKGYTYCDYKRIGSVRHMKRTWQLDPTCNKEEKIK